MVMQTSAPLSRPRLAALRLPAIAAAAGTVIAITAVAAQSGRSDATARMIAALELHEGSVVAEIGAGAGERTVAIAKHVGAAGRVFTSELGASNLEKLRKAVEAGGLQNVTVIEAGARETNLPEQCCDALFMENVYHHFEDPPAMNASILRSLKPGGRVAIVDFAPPPDAEAERPQDRDTDGHHGVTSKTVQAELEQAGFETVKVDATGDRGFLLVVRKPTTPPSNR